MTTEKDYKIRFHNSIVWQYEMMVKSLCERGYVWQVDFWGYKPANDATHLGFANNDVYSDAIEIQESIS